MPRRGYIIIENIQYQLAPSERNRYLRERDSFTEFHRGFTEGHRVIYIFLRVTSCLLRVLRVRHLTQSNMFFFFVYFRALFV